MWNKFDKDLGLLLLRLGTGMLFIRFGFLKLHGGPDLWEKIGAAIGNIGIHFAPVFWGLMAGLSEFGGGILLILGFLFRPTLCCMLFTMLMAALLHFSNGDGLNGATGAIQCAVVFVSLFIAGPGKYVLKLK